MFVFVINEDTTEKQKWTYQTTALAIWEIRCTYSTIPAPTSAPKPNDVVYLNKRKTNKQKYPNLFHI